MIAIQSFWTKPNLSTGQDRSLGGFLSMRYNLQSWGLSSSLLQQVYGTTRLITDQQGKKLLIEQLALPYTQTDVLLDALNDYPQELWALGKMRSYELQEEPFVHVDHDAFLWQRLPKRMEQAAVLAQSPEKLVADVPEVFEQVIEQFDYFPDAFQTRLQQPDPLKSFNAGLLGGQDVTLLQTYAREAFHFVNRNDFGRIPQERWPTVNMFFEQLMLQCFCTAAGIAVTCLFEDGYPYNLLEQYTYRQLRRQPGYIHLMWYKKSAEMARWVDRWLLETNPEVYYRIEWYCKRYLL